jgi:hypothetical protein
VRKTTPHETAPFDLRSKSAAAEAEPFLGRMHALLLTVIEQLEGL